jgi:hypothetical protein
MRPEANCSAGVSRAIINPPLSGACAVSRYEDEWDRVIVSPNQLATTVPFRVQKNGVLESTL